MNDSSTVATPALPSFGPRPQGIPIAPMSMQKILTKAIRSHGKSTNLKITAVKGPDKMGGKRGSSRAGRTGKATGKTTTATARK